MQGEAPGLLPRDLCGSAGVSWRSWESNGWDGMQLTSPRMPAGSCSSPRGLCPCRWLELEGLGAVARAGTSV